MNAPGRPRLHGAPLLAAVVVVLVVLALWWWSFAGEGRARTRLEQQTPATTP
jgi:hypothetical protein